MSNYEVRLGQLGGISCGIKMMAMEPIAAQKDAIK